MQSFRLKKPFPFFRPAFRRQSKHLLSALLVTATMTGVCRAQATQTAEPPKERFDLGVGAFYQVTSASNGNFLREDTTSSGGALIDFRQPYRPWLGYQAQVGFTKFYEAYNKGIVKTEDNVTDVNFAYLLESPPVYGVQPYFTIGGGVIVFSPISGTLTDVNGSFPNGLGSQLLPEFTYSLGLSMPVFRRLGVRGGMRGLKYKTPDFHQDLLDTHTLRNTLEPYISVYYRF
jgi:hypothetical protein